MIAQSCSDYKEGDTCGSYLGEARINELFAGYAEVLGADGETDDGAEVGTVWHELLEDDMIN